MTANQINYQKALEDARSNRANEQIKRESNVISSVANDIKQEANDLTRLRVDYQNRLDKAKADEASSNSGLKMAQTQSELWKGTLLEKDVDWYEANKLGQVVSGAIKSVGGIASILAGF